VCECVRKKSSLAFGLAPSIRQQDTRQFTSAQQIDQFEGLAVAIPWGFESPLPHDSTRPSGSLMASPPFDSASILASSVIMVLAQIADERRRARKPFRRQREVPGRADICAVTTETHL
jgi:hypothetical protein